MTKETAIAAGIDYEQGVQRFVGNVAMYEKYLNRFHEDTNYSMMKEALEKNELEDAFKYAHALKGLVGNLSMNHFYKNIVALVEELRAGNLEKGKSLMSEIDAEYHNLIHVLES